MRWAEVPESYLLWGAIERPCPECAARPGELCVLRSPPATGAEKTRHIPPCVGRTKGDNE